MCCRQSSVQAVIKIIDCRWVRRSERAFVGVFPHTDHLGNITFYHCLLLKVFTYVVGKRHAQSNNLFYTLLFTSAAVIAEEFLPKSFMHWPPMAIDQLSIFRSTAVVIFNYCSHQQWSQPQWCWNMNETHNPNWVSGAIHHTNRGPCFPFFSAMLLLFRCHQQLPVNGSNLWSPNRPCTQLSWYWSWNHNITFLFSA